MPVCVVTSANHHDVSFYPLRAAAPDVPYIDYLVDGKKPWRSALEMILE